LTIDLVRQTITTPGKDMISFEIDPFRKETLVQGLDAIARTLQLQHDIAAYEASRKEATPWYDACLNSAKVAEH
jgi:3-isopropylmalate/(R)-2-methylmalate dehydratase small subunit